ncbi:hypothetical protein ES319_D05G388800v1 [Gossypium barbadense]|uniref:Indole-3-acetic acid-amido synthetase GH3.17 n=2 Tax=Gossypium TaxID=3633 RepID=A0A1U8J4E8_GOSHI|nr:indole-3-acetic acid-amido synthetase GH3.17-like [Gossypium hirsutum]KAB2032641.1 hypothetical protein ES319_D05G388800v1 [Gossypium barbadense]PPD85790.1 hypothetical protein GOBAR_DD17271 [Gossypium barbadense]
MEKSRIEYLLKKIEEQTSNAGEEQEKILENILKRNAETDYLNKFLHGQTDKQLFKKYVPVVTYEDIKSYIDRIVDGEPPNILTTETITEFILSSGTSGGEPKYVLSTADCSQKRASIPMLMEAVMHKHIEGLDKGKGMYLLFSNPDFDTPSGLKARMFSSSYLSSPTFKTTLFKTVTTPIEIILSLNKPQSMYCQLLIGLIRRHEVLRIGTIFASTFPNCIKFLQDHWKDICSDIRTGHLSDWITEPDCRTPMLSFLLEPNSELADLLEPIFKNESWEGIITKLWPKAKYIDAIVTGSMSQYIGLIDYYSGRLPIISTFYNSSEACFGINMEPLNKPWDVSYTFLPNMAYFEFIPVDKESPQKAQKLHFNGVSNEESIEKLENGSAQIVDLVDVKMGQFYEVVVTTLAGLYRYRVGDILKVTGFHNKSPKFQFVERQNVALSIDRDKTSEADLSKAIKAAEIELEPHGFLLTAYSSFADTWSIPGRYILFWELKLRDSNTDRLKLDSNTMEQCCRRVEESLDFTYRLYRKMNLIGPLEIRVVKFGAFDELMNFFVSRGAAPLQYKTPCCLKIKEAIEILDSRVVGKFFSNGNLA